MAGNILIVDDEEQLRKLLERILSLEGFTVNGVATLQAAEVFLKRETVDVILCDVKLPDGNGVDFTATVRKQYPLTEVILLTAFATINDGVRAMKNGAFDYIMKGDDNDRILPLLHQAVEISNHARQCAVSMQVKPDQQFSSVIGTSAAIKQAVTIASRAATSNVPVLLLGETGVGKEVFANAIHQNSTRSRKAFVAINCSAFSRDLLEGELFGHRAGAFTGAIRDKKGLVEAAEGGTLFLDEIGELNLDLQAKLLRFLENGEFFKVGDSRVSKADVRIVAATNRDLQQEMEQHRFREDLYYRLNVVAVHIPPLRERREDIPLLADFFLRQFNQQENRSFSPLAAEIKQLLQQYDWPGNIRELKNVLFRAMILADDNMLRPEHFPFDVQLHQEHSDHLSLSEVEKRHILKMLDASGGNKTKAAQLLGIGLATLYRKMQEYDLSK